MSVSRIALKDGTIALSLHFSVLEAYRNEKDDFTWYLVNDEDGYYSNSDRHVLGVSSAGYVFFFAKFSEVSDYWDKVKIHKRLDHPSLPKELLIANRGAVIDSDIVIEELLEC